MDKFTLVFYAKPYKTIDEIISLSIINNLDHIVKDNSVCLKLHNGEYTFKYFQEKLICVYSGTRKKMLAGIIPEFFHCFKLAIKTPFFALAISNKLIEYSKHAHFGFAHILGTTSELREERVGTGLLYDYDQYVIFHKQYKDNHTQSRIFYMYQERFKQLQKLLNEDLNKIKKVMLDTKNEILL